MTYSTRLKKIAENYLKKKKSRSCVADRLGVSRSTLWSWLRNPPENRQRQRVTKRRQEIAKRRASVVRAAEKLRVVAGVKYPVHTGARSIVDALKLTVSPRTVRRDLRVSGLTPYVRKGFQHGSTARFRQKRISVGSFWPGQGETFGAFCSLTSRG